MFSKNSFFILITLAIIVILKLLSFLVFMQPAWGALVFIVLALSFLLISAYKLEWGLVIVLGELIAGSMGHLFTLSWGSLSISLRMSFWALIILVFIIKFAWQLKKVGSQSLYYQKIRSFANLKYFFWLFAFLGLALLNGFLRGHAISNILLDFNAWLYLLLLFPAVAVYEKDISDRIMRLVFLAAVFWLSLETLSLLFIFSHNSWLAPDIYTWLRRTLSAEITPTLSGWPRIFIQSQIYSGLAFFLVFWVNLKNLFNKKFWQKNNLINLLLAAFFLSALIISFSRSFWVALIVTIVFSLVFIAWRLSLKKAARAALWLIASLGLGFLMVYAIAVSGGAGFSSELLNRVSSGQEAALASRWSLLPVLIKEISQNPFIGQGYGATVTYFSQDPRVLQTNPSGEYTTYAFEWGYLDLWLKLGGIGLLIYLGLIMKLFLGGLTSNFLKNNLDNLSSNDFLRIGLSAGLLFLAATNLFTPYLNHPLGLGFLIISSCLILSDRVY